MPAGRSGDVDPNEPGFEPALDQATGEKRRTKTPKRRRKRADATNGNESQGMSEVISDCESTPRRMMTYGSVWESNPQAALFTPPTGFEDQGPHQRCKHSREDPSCPSKL